MERKISEEVVQEINTRLQKYSESLHSVTEYGTSLEPDMRSRIAALVELKEALLKKWKIK